MIKAGITGGIGSGKSIVCEIFRTLGIPVFVSDNISRQLIDQDQDIKDQLVSLFGKDIFNNDGRLEKEKLSKLIFGDRNALKKVNAVVHPAVKKKFNEWSGQYYDHKYVIKESALLFESGNTHELDVIIMVYAPESFRIKRIIERDNLPEERIKAIIANQINDEEKIRMSDHIIYNDETQLLIPQVLKLDNLLRSGKKK